MGSAWWQCAACLRSQEEDICELQLNHCNLYDVPPDVFIYERTLEKLYLDANRIKDLPRPLFQCHELRVLSLSDNEISTLPPAIASLINLEYLDLSKNSRDQFDIKELPNSIKECKSLCSIDISVNPFERFPDAITYIVGLRELYINDAYIEYLPANFGRLSALRTLELRENNMMTLPKSMSRLINLQRLDIGNNDFTELPEVVGDLVNLTELWIDGNDIRRVPTNIEQLYRLNHFDCTMNAVHVLPSEIQGWRDISIMNLSSNELYELPDSLCFLRTIVTLKIDDNQLNSLPNDIGQMSSLEELIVTKNFLECLPSSIGLLRKLHCLNADNNYLRCLPAEIGSCTALSLLSLRSNNISHVPPELGHLSSLRVLNLVNNCIKFLPVSMLNLTNLKALWLSDNQSQPLVPLQQEFNSEEDMMVLSCFMLPQKPRQDLEQMPHATGPMSSSTIIATGRRICFAAEVESELPKQLQRAPTPYPKELRSLARHARNLHHQSVHEHKTQIEQDTVIKEAKIAKSTVNIEQLTATKGGRFNKADHCTELTPSLVDISDLTLSRKKSTSADPGMSNSNSEESSDEATKTVLAKKKNPDIREARYVRNATSDCSVKLAPTAMDYVDSTWRPEEYTKANTAMIVESEKLTEPYKNGLNFADGALLDGRTTNLQFSRANPVPPPIPPPYHIAAAFSKKAAFFQQLDNVSRANVRSGPCSPLIPDTQCTEEMAEEHRPLGIEEGELPTDDADGVNENNANNEASLALPETYVPVGDTRDAEPTLAGDRSQRPSKIPVLRGNGTCSSEHSKKMPYCYPTNQGHSQTLNGTLIIPTSPITGKKYRCPLSAQTHWHNMARPQVELSASAVNLNIANENDNGVDTGTAAAGVQSLSNSGRSTPQSMVPLSGSETPPASTISSSDRKQPLKWMFGPHRNASVLPVQLRKNPGLGFSIAGGVAGAETGIIVTKVNPEGPARGALRPGDKILEVDGIDFTKSDHDSAVAVLRATGAVVSMMISRHQ